MFEDLGQSRLPPMTTPRRVIPQNRGNYTQPAASLFRKIRLFASHPLYCAVCHAPGGEYRRLFGLHDIFARHHRHRHARIGVYQHHKHRHCPEGLSFPPSKTPSPSLCHVLCGGVLPEMVPMGRCASGFAGLGALARRVIVRWADGDNPMLVGGLRTAYVGLTLLVPSR